METSGTDNGPAPTEVETERVVRPRPPDSPTDPALAELVRSLAAELRDRWRHGDRVAVEQYFLRHPALGSSAEGFTLVCAEFLLREELGEAPSLDEYRRRFPPYADRLEPPGRTPPARTPDRTPGPRRPGRADLPAVPGYDVLGVLGRGGMGVVYKARQHGLGRTVALKMILGGPLADPESKARFQAEAVAAARLQHPNIVQIFAVGTLDSPLGEGFACPYFAQEFVDGGALDRLLCGVPHPPRETARLVETLARAVHFAHEHGIVHRDLKPANILLRRVGGPPDRFPVPLSLFEPKVGDFGLAKQIDGTGGRLTMSGAIVGTPEYMAPEQAVGSPRVGPGVDVYALGVILYEILTGRRPFAGGTPLETLELVLRQDPVPPSRLQPKVPRDLETVCLKCLRKQPHKRYPTALALAEDLARFVRGEPVLARPVGLPERAWRWAVRRPTVAALTAAVALAVVGGLGGITAAWLHALAGWAEADRLRIAAADRQAEAEAQRQRAERAQAVAERRRDESEVHLYFSRVAQARLESRSGNFTSAERLLDQCAPDGDGAVDRRGWEWHHLKGILHSDLLTIPAAHGGFVTDLAFSPDGRRLLTAGGIPFRDPPPDAVRVWEVWGETAGRKVREFPHLGMVWAAAYVADGRQVVWSGSDGTVRAADAETGRALWSRPLPPKSHPVIAVSPDGRRYAASDSEGRVWVWDTATGRETFATRAGDRAPIGLAFAPGGDRLAVALPDAVRVWDVAADREVRALPHANWSRGRPAFSPDGRLVAQGTADGLVRVWDAATGQLVQTVAGHPGGTLAVAFAPDGDRLATAGADRTVRLWSVAAGTEQALFHGHDGRVASLAFHPSGRYLASGGQQPGDVKVWDLTRHQEYVRAVRNLDRGGQVQAIGFSGDSNTLYAARARGWLQTTDPATGADLNYRPIDLTGKWLVPAAVAAFSGDGRRLATVSGDDLRMVAVSDPAGGARLHRLEHPYEVVYLAFSGDGRRLATSAVAWKGDGRREVRVWDAEAGRVLTTVRCDPYLPGGIYGTVAISPDGRLLAHDEREPKPGPGGKPVVMTRVVIRDAETGDLRGRLDDVAVGGVRLAFGPDGRYLATASEDTGIRVYDCRAGRWLHEQPLPGSRQDSYYDLAFSPDGRRLAGVSREQVLFWDVASGQMGYVLRGARPRSSDNGFNPRVVWSPDGRRLAASNWDLSVSVWDAAERESPAAKRALRQAAEARAGRP